MTDIYLIRHCEATGNAKRAFQGTSDCEISELGAKQLEYLKKRFENFKFDKIYSSPLKRTVATAIAAAGDRADEIEICDGLIEINGGIYEGKPFRETFLKVQGLADIWNNHPQDFAPPKGEPMRHAYERIWETVKEIAENNKGKTVICATHGGVTRCLMCRLMFKDINRLKDVPWSENTAVTHIRFDDNLKPEIVFYNDHSHVPDQYLPKRNRIVDFLAENEDKKQ